MSRPPLPPPASSKLRVRGVIVTAGITAITIMGVWVGAGLKSEQEVKEMRKKAATDDGQDALLDALMTRRRALVQAKAQWEQKAAALRARMERNSSSSSSSSSSTSTSTSTTPGK